MRHTDENHAESADNIAAYLQELGIDAERRSIYRDIEEINKALWLLENEDDADIFAAEEAIEMDENDSEKFIVYHSLFRFSFSVSIPLLDMAR